MSFYSIEGNPLIRSKLNEYDGRIDRNTDTGNIIADAVNLGILGWAPTGNNREILYNQNSGNVGIGTNNPQSKLDVVGNVAISTFLDVYGNITSTNGNIEVDLGNLVINDGKLIVKQSAPNPLVGTATLVAGTVTVNTTKASLNSCYGFATHKTFGGTPGILRVTTANGSLTITSSSNLDTSTVNWILITGV